MQRSTQSLLLVLFIIAGLVSACAVPTPTPSSTQATHPITHAMGESEVPVTPQRVVVLDTGELDNALALGASIIGAPVAEAREYQAYLADQLEGITDTGAISEPSLETILSLKPDLILGSKQRHEAIYQQLSAIAPTVFTESLRVPWQDNFNLHAEALGKSAEAEALLAAYAARTAQIQAALGDNPPTISIIRFRPGQVRLYLKSSYIGYILQEVGLPRPPAQDQDVFSAEISLEQVADIDADYIFITGYAQDDSDQDTFLQSELWTTLHGVQSGHAIDVNDDTWIAGLGVQSANLVLDDLVTLLGLTIDQTTVAAPTTAAAFPITIEHDDGETTFTEPVERIVTLSEEMMELPIALGIYPVGTASERTPNAEQGKPFTYRYAEAVSQSAMTYVGLESAPSLEAIALLQPDLIITPNGYGKERYDQLTQIAPTLTFDGADRLYWQAALPALAQLLGKEAAAQQVIAAFDAELNEARRRLAPIVATKPRLALLFLPAPTMTFMVNQQFAFGATLADLGMEIVSPDSVTFNEAGSVQVSDEVVAQVATDAFIIFRFTAERFTIDELLTSHPAPKLDYIINTERPAAGPITDFDYLRDLAALLVSAHGTATTR